MMIIIRRLENYIQKHEEGLITAIRNDTDNTMDNRMTITRKQKWEGKQLYGRFKRLINNISHEKTWTWLRKGNCKRETESLRIAAQNSIIHQSALHQKAGKCGHGVDWQKKPDTVPQIWIIECLKMFKISDKIINFLTKALENWRIKLTAAEQILAEIKLQKGILKENAYGTAICYSNGTAQLRN